MSAQKVKILWHWQAMGPYHFARMNALSRLPEVELLVAETASIDDHGWTRKESERDFRMVTLGAGLKSNSLAKQTRRAFGECIRDFRPQAIVACGYHEPHSLSEVLSYVRNRADCVGVLWSESTAADRSRAWWKESVKRTFVSAFDGALVAGEPHSRFLEELGMESKNIQIVGNCVDNEFFSRNSDEVRRSTTDYGLPKSFFVFVGRFIPEKNLPILIEAFRLYRQSAGRDPWDLVLVGDGRQESVLRDIIAVGGVKGVSFAGLRQLAELPRYYGRAKCFILPSISEPWGLVVNEAMASGLPVLVSRKCGCAAELVEDGINGFVFDPSDAPQLAGLLRKVASGSLCLESMGAIGRSKVEAYSPVLFAQRSLEHLMRLSRNRTGTKTASRHRMRSDLFSRPRAELIAAAWARLS